MHIRIRQLKRYVFNFQNGGKTVLNTIGHDGYVIQFKQVTTIQSKMLNLVKLCFLPIYSQLCDTSWIHGDTMWLEELSVNYTSADFVYYNTGNKEIADVRLNPCKVLCEEKTSEVHSF